MIDAQVDGDSAPTACSSPLGQADAQRINDPVASEDALGWRIARAMAI